MVDLKAKLQGAYKNSESSGEGDYKKYGESNYSKENKKEEPLEIQQEPVKTYEETEKIHKETSPVSNELSLTLVEKVVSAYELLDKIDLTENILNTLGVNSQSSAAEIILAYIKSGANLFSKVDEILKLYQMNPVDMAYSLMSINNNELEEIEGNVSAICGERINADINSDKINYCRQIQSLISNLSPQQVEQLQEMAGNR